MTEFSADSQWFCVRSKPCRQNLAAAHLRSLGVEVFNPQLRFLRSTRQGPAWRTVPLFPNYIFARFELLGCFRRVRYGMGVSDVVNFGGRWSVLPDREIAELRAQWGEEEALVPEQTVSVGDAVTLSGGIFHGMSATVVAVLPARQRVRVLLEFLGGLNETEVESAAVLPIMSHPLAA